MRLGSREKEILQEIASLPHEAALTFLLSRGSIARMYSVMDEIQENKARKQKKYRELKDQRKRQIKRLEKKGLVKLVTRDDDVHITLSDRGFSYAGIYDLYNKIHNHHPTEWDGEWTLVMFDVPQEESQTRKALMNLLCRVGFIQTQMSNYIFPYDAPEVEDFLKRNPQLGRHCQIFRGRYRGDDSPLREKFNLR